MNKWNFSTVDALGIIAATLCVLHCISTSIAVMILPYYGAALWQSDLTHQLFASVAVFFCVTSIALSYRKTQDKKVLAFFTSGLCLLISATFLLPGSMHERYEVYILSLGSSALIMGHIRNLRYLMRCC